MEDKELQELFDAKRTVETNRRRQEALRELLEARDKRRSRPLWPVWTGAAAAAIALLLLTLPSLFGKQESAPLPVARTEVPEVQPAPALEEAAPTVHAAPQHVKPARTEKTAEAEEPENIDTIGTIDTIKIEEAAPAVTVPADVAPTPRVMRRTSTLIACTEGCKPPEGVQETPSNSNVKVNLFPASNYADATIYSIPINK